jgi:hypothetical protein
MSAMLPVDLETNLMAESRIDPRFSAMTTGNPKKSAAHRTRRREEMLVFTVLIICTTLLVVTAAAWGIHPGEGSIDNWLVGP